MQNPEYIRNALAQAIGTSQYWKVFPDFLITDGVKIMVELCGANWLITEIFLLSRNEKVRKEYFVVWKLALKVHQLFLLLMTVIITNL